MAISQEDLLYSKASWEYITQQYRQRWTKHRLSIISGLYAPCTRRCSCWRILPPGSRRYVADAISTGYAGLLGGRYGRGAAFRSRRPDGIYTKERKMDLAQATGPHDHNDDVCNPSHDEMGYIRGLSIRFYEKIGRMADGQASPMKPVGRKPAAPDRGLGRRRKNALTTAASTWSVSHRPGEASGDGAADTGTGRAGCTHQGYQDIHQGVADMVNRRRTSRDAESALKMKIRCTSPNARKWRVWVE